MKKILSYKDLLVWQKAIDLSVLVYRLSSAFPPAEVYGLTNQLRKAANSVCLNIAEGQGRQSTRTFVYFLNIAKGSLNEVETALILSERLGFATSNDLKAAFLLIEEESKMLYSLIEKLSAKLTTNH
jgi:four helix bundle protein